MSLDVYINYKKPKPVKKRVSCGSTILVGCDRNAETRFNSNITHNMTKMAMNIPIDITLDGVSYVGTLYDFVWRPEENDVCNTNKLKDILSIGISYMIQNRLDLLRYNPENGWGSYDGFLHWLINYKEACEDNPDCEIEVSR